VHVDPVVVAHSTRLLLATRMGETRTFSYRVPDGVPLVEEKRIARWIRTYDEALKQRLDLKPLDVEGTTWMDQAEPGYVSEMRRAYHSAYRGTKRDVSQILQRLVLRAPLNRYRIKVG
jgi:hypothetical protein